MVYTWWSPQLNALLGSLVVATGAWLAWDSFSLWEVSLVAAGVAGFLIWQGRTIGLVWAWATLLLGVESLAWPIITMVQISSITTEPNDEQMGTHDRTGLGLGYPVAWGGESCLAHHHDGSDQLDHDGAERRTNGDARSDWSGPGLPCCLGWRVLPGPSSRWFRSARSRRSRTTNKWGRTIGLVWAWATLLLGVESLAWPIITMVQISSITTEPNDEQ